MGQDRPSRSGYDGLALLTRPAGASVAPPHAGVFLVAAKEQILTQSLAYSTSGSL